MKLKRLKKLMDKFRPDADSEFVGFWNYVPVWTSPWCPPDVFYFLGDAKETKVFLKLIRKGGKKHGTNSKGIRN